MANRDVFSTGSKSAPATDHKNRAGGRAYRLDAKNALAKAAVTGCFSNTFYADARTQVKDVLEMADACDAKFVAKVAVFSRERGFMKDMPAFLAAWLHAKGETDLLKAVFPKVIDNGRMLRNFVQMVRSGALGRKSFGHSAKRLIQAWLLGRHPAQMLNDSVGKDPSLADILKMVHPKAPDAERVALHGYLLGKEHNAEELPENVKEYEAWKADPEAHEVPKVPFQMLTFGKASTAVWKSIARNARWMMTRMNLNTFKRHGVFEDPEMVDLVAQRLADPKEVRFARAFPYQLMTAYQNTSDVPMKVREALQDAMEVATENVPDLGRVAVLVDTSGSMQWASITGGRRGSTSVTKAVDVAALIASVILRKNKEAKVIPFDTRVHKAVLNPRDTVLTNAGKLKRYGGGGTACSAAMEAVLREGKQYDLVLMVSDNESWADYQGWRGSAGPFQSAWTQYRKKFPEAKLALIDLTPSRSVQAKIGDEVLLVGGFSDMVFDVLSGFMESKDNDWIATVEKTKL